MSRTTLDNCKDITNWVKIIKKVKVSLMKLNSIISQWIVTITFLHDLPLFYNSFVEIVINFRDKDVNERSLKPDFDDMCERVLNRERRQKVLIIDQFNFKVLKAAGKANSANSNVNSNSKSKSQGKGEGKRIKCDECNWFHGGDCWMTHSEKANQVWRDKNKDRLVEFQKKKSEKKNKNKGKEKACCAINASIKDPGFYFDSAASLHYTYFMTWYREDPTLLNEPIEVKACDEGTVYATHRGTIQLDTLITNDDGNDEECRLSIKDVHFCPEMNTNLLSLGTLVRNGLSFGAAKKRLTVTDDDDDTIMEGALINTLFKLRLSDAEDVKAKDVARHVAMTAKRPHKKASAKFWHETLGHLNYTDVARLPAMVTGMKVVGSIKKEFCEPCALAKQHKTSSREPMSAVNDSFHRIHTNLLGGKDSLLLTIKGLKYASTLTDQNTRYRWVNFLKTKNQALSELKNFVKYVQTQFNIISRIIRSDNDEKYNSEEVRNWLKFMKII